MKRTHARAILLLASLLIASNGYGAEISWTLPTSYKDGTPIDPSEAGKIVVEVYSGPTKEGPWVPVATSYPGGTRATVPDLPPATTCWYTVKSRLNGAKSEFASPVRKTNYSIPIPPFVKKIAKKMITRRKILFLTAMMLVLGLAWLVRYRGKRRKG